MNYLKPSTLVPMPGTEQLNKLDPSNTASLNYCTGWENFKHPGGNTNLTTEKEAHLSRVMISKHN